MAVWDEFFKQEEFRWKDPGPHVVKLTLLLEERGAHRVLDLGCGAGRHLVYLTKQGLKVYGVDISENGLELARRLVEREGLKGEAHGRAPLLKKPYAGTKPSASSIA